jgi:ABC-type cobalamin/Fe3+-siderophores transport system ATPase subunit
MSAESETFRIVQLTAENIKKLKAVDITPPPDEHVIQVTGNNGSGKSSLLDCIYWALGGTKDIQEQPIRHGEESAQIELDLGGIIVKRKFNAKGTSLIVENAEGARFPSPQTMLDKLLGNLSFDPLEFARMSPKEQYDQLKAIAGLDEIEELEALNVQDFTARTQVNRELGQVQAQVSAIKFEGEETGKLKLIDMGKLATKFQKASEANIAVERESTRRQGRELDLEGTKREIKEISEKLLLLQQKQARIEAEVGAWPPLAEKTDTSNLKDEVKKAEANNRDVEACRRREKLLEQAAQLKAKSESLTAGMDARNQTKAKAIQNADMPVAGLEPENGVVKFKGIPFSQCSTAEQIRISTALAMAVNPKMRVIRIKEGSLLDNKSMQIIGKLAKENDYQVWIERISAADGKMVVVIENGEVKS